MSLFSNNTDITDGIDLNIWRAIDKAIAKNSIESFRVLKSFVRHVLHISISNNSLKHFRKYIFFPANYYSISHEKANRNSNHSDIHKFCSEEAARDLKEIIWLDINYGNQNGIDFKKNENEFYYWAFQGFGKLLYYILMNGDINQFRFAMNEYEQISEENISELFNLKWEIRDLIKQNTNGQNDEPIKNKKEELNKIKQLGSYKRHVLVGVKYWIFFLYQEDKINEETAKQFLELINIPYVDPGDLLSDILFFRDNSLSFSYMGWAEWDYIERQSGKVYSPPQPHQWLTLGFFADQIREKRYFVNASELDSEDLSQVSFLFDDLKLYSKIFEESFEKWKNILSLESIEIYKFKSAEILKDFAILKRKSVTDIDRAIALSPIYQPHVDNFKLLIGEAWKSQARIHRTFKYFGNTLNVNDQEIKLKQIGQRIFFEKAKMMFIEENNQQIIGIDRIGGQIGRWEDNYFLSVIRQVDHNRVSGTNILEVLNKSICELKNKEKKPNYILISHKYSYKDEKFLKSEFFKSKLNFPIQKNDIDIFCIGEYDGIPVYTSLSETLNNFILICNFNEAFQQLYKTNEDWFEKELTVDIQLVTDEIAQNKLAENRAKWTTLEDGSIQTDEEAILQIKTAIIIDIWTTLEYKILDKDAYVLGYFKTEIEE